MEECGAGQPGSQYGLSNARSAVSFAVLHLQWNKEYARISIFFFNFHIFVHILRYV